jgi:hypothetical protein
MKLWTMLMGTLLLSACVTINIYFPAAAAEKMADRIIDEVWQVAPNAAERAAPPAASSNPKEAP